MNFKKIKKIFYLISNTPKYIKLLWNLSKDKRVPAYLKIFAAGAIAYFFVPLDIKPDFIPGAGLIDDFVLMLIIIEKFIALCPKDIIEEHLNNIKAKRSDFDNDIKKIKETSSYVFKFIKNNLNKIIQEYSKK